MRGKTDSRELIPVLCRSSVKTRAEYGGGLQNERSAGFRA